MNNDAPITNSQLAATLRGWADTLSPTPPPVAEDKDDEHAQSPAPTTGTANTRPYAAVVADGKVAPAFDAEKWADAVIRSVNVTVTVIGNRCSADIPAGAKAAVVGLVNAIYAAGAASVKPRRWPEQKPRLRDKVMIYNPAYMEWVSCEFDGGWDNVTTWWLPQPPSPEAAQ